MDTYFAIEDYLKDEPLAVALGLFDGMHIGHAEVISMTVEAAKTESLIPAVFTFSQNPLSLIAPESAPCALITAEEKFELLHAAGIERIFSFPFDPAMCRMNADDYVRDLLYGSLHAAHIVVGENHRFGAKAAGDSKLLARYCEEAGVGLSVVAGVKIGGREVSSTEIRKAVSVGHLEEAAALLGRRYSLSGAVTHGKHLGRSIEVPTANLIPAPGLVLPASGVYVTEVAVGEAPSQLLRAVTNVGSNPTVGGEGITVESHILDFDEDIYCEKISVNFISQIRGEEKFRDLAELKLRIERDIATTRSYFETGNMTFTGRS